MPIDTRINIDPNDSDAMLEAIRELAKAVEALERRFTTLELQVDNLRTDIDHIEDKPSSD